MRRLLPSLPLLALLLAIPVRTASPDADPEKAVHGDEAASPQITLDEVSDGLRVRQYRLGCLSQLTYLVTSRGEAAVIDPQRDVDHYRRDAKALGVKITHVLLTHTNADFVAGHTDLARDGAVIHISAESGSKFPHDGLKDGSVVTVGDATIEALATPGHTLDSMTFVLRPRKDAAPWGAFTGDTLFIGGIGRPDLVGGETTPVRLASLAFDSMERLKALPDETRVLPAHGAGSLCGAHLSPDTVSTIGKEKASNPYLAPSSRARFVSRVVTGLPVAPAYFAQNVRINRDGPPVLDGRPPAPPALDPAAFDAARAQGAWVVDLREAAPYAAGHVEGAVNVAIRGRLDTWIGTVVPFDARLLLVGTDAEAEEAAFRLRRIGIDRVDGSLAGGMDAWKAAGKPVRTTPLWTPARLRDAIAAGTEPVLVDVRTEGESADVRIGDYALIPVSEADRFGRVLDRNAPVVFVCNSAYRSSLAVGLAERQGFTSVGSLDGGLDGWLAAGFPVVGAAAERAMCGDGVCPTPAAAPPGTGAGARDGVLLPEAIAPTSLASGLADQPATWAVLDVRPAHAFAEFHVPGAVRVDVDGLVAHVRGLAATVRVVVVDRDGSSAFAAAGVLAASFPGRSFRALSGGTAAWWREIDGGAGSPVAPAAPSRAASPPPPAPSAPSPTPAPRKRPAGC